jgi:hypothetical protein
MQMAMWGRDSEGQGYWFLVASCALLGRGGVGRSKGERVRSLEDGVADLWVPGKGGYKNWANTRLIFSKSSR